MSFRQSFVCATRAAVALGAHRLGARTASRPAACAGAVRHFAAPNSKGKKSKAQKKSGGSNVDIPKQDVEWALSFLEPEWSGEMVTLEPEDAARLTEATKAYQRFIGREKRRMDGEIHRLIKLRGKALDHLPEDLRELALRPKPDTEPQVRLPTWTPPDKLYR